MIRRLTLLVGLLSSALVLAGLPVLQAQAAAKATAAGPTTAVAGQSQAPKVTTVKPTLVTVSQLPSAASTKAVLAPRVQSPLRVSDPATYAAAKNSPTGRPGVQIGPQSGSHVDFTFPGIDNHSEAAAQGFVTEPPDTQMAVGSNQVVEMANSTVQVFDKTFPNTALITPFALKSFFGIPDGYFNSDPRVLYDYSTDRWYASLLAYNSANDSVVLLAVSRTGNALGVWAVYPLLFSTGLLCDQPKLGYSDDKFDLACTEFNSSGGFVGGVVMAAGKAQGLAATAINVISFGPFVDVNSAVPAQPIGSGLPAFMVENMNHFHGGSNAAAARLWTWTGNPSTDPTHVVYNITSASIPATTIPPQAIQPGVSATAIDSGDDRFMSAVVLNGELWTSTTEGCTPNGDSTPRACMRVLQINLAGHVVDQTSTAGISGKYIYYPTLSVDSVGNLTIVYSLSSAADYPGIYTTQQAVGSPGVFANGGPIELGTQAYTGTRWGDYGGAATDTLVPRTVWIAGEWSTATGSAPGIPSWSTGIGRIDSFVPPLAPTNLTPVAGDTTISLTWTDAADDGGSPVTNHRVTPYINGVAQAPVLTGSTSTSFTVTGLTDWLAYTFSVAAINLYGTGAESAQSAPADPFTPPTWSSLGGVLNSGPAVTSWSSTREDVFVRGADNALWHNSWNGTVWTGWGPLGGVFLGDPAAISRSVNKIDVFVRGADNALWTRNTIDGGLNWGAWQSLGGVLASGPEVASWSATHMDVFVRGADNALWRNTLDGANPWTGWSSVGGVLNGDPMAVSTLANTIDAFVRGADNALWQNTFSGGVWSGWHTLGGVLASAADAASCTGGHIEVMVKGADNRLWHKGYTGTQWTIWEPLGGVFTSDSGSVCRTTTQTVEIMGRGADNALWEGTITGIS